MRATLLHLASKVKVPAVTNGSIHPIGDPAQLLVLQGAFTGYDRVVNSRAGALKVRFGGVELRLAGDKSYDLISADFSWRRNGSPHIQGGISLVVAVETRSGEGDIYLQDSKDPTRGMASTVRVQSIQGIHQSQRSMAEFATIAMLAQATGISLADCTDRASPSLVEETNKAFKSKSAMERSRAAQTLLKKLGYNLAVDGLWGPASQAALNRFLLGHSMPPSSTLAAEHYVTLTLADRGALRP